MSFLDKCDHVVGRIALAVGIEVGDRPCRAIAIGKVGKGQRQRVYAIEHVGYQNATGIGEDHEVITIAFAVIVTDIDEPTGGISSVTIVGIEDELIAACNIEVTTKREGYLIIEDGIAAMTRTCRCIVEVEVIFAGSANQVVIAFTTGQIIVAVAASDQVIAFVTEQVVVAVLTLDYVSVLASVNDVVTAIPVQPVKAGTTRNVVSLPDNDRTIVTIDDIVAVIALEGIHAKVTGDDVIAVTA